eukprot:g39178.t1
MKHRPRNCPALTISNKREHKYHPLTFSDIIISEYSTINILWVTIDQKLISYLNAVATRASQRLGILWKDAVVLEGVQQKFTRPILGKVGLMYEERLTKLEM